ncbi:hypothetical protein Agub_g8655, partial [Astrephomene gubernaculifera]
VAVREPLEWAKTCAAEVWRFSSAAYFSLLEGLRRPYYGEPLDMSPGRLAGAVLLALLCGLLSASCVLVLGLLRLPFVVARALGEWMSKVAACPTRLMCLWMPLWVLAVPGIPVGVLLGFILLLLGCCVYLGPTCGVVAYMSASAQPVPYRSPYLRAKRSLFTALDVMYSH